ncbi:unnamed protein product, partial [Chrysoparadoxa australica]
KDKTGKWLLELGRMVDPSFKPAEADQPRSLHLRPRTYKYPSCGKQRSILLWMRRLGVKVNGSILGDTVTRSMVNGELLSQLAAAVGHGITGGRGIETSQIEQGKFVLTGYTPKPRNRAQALHNITQALDVLGNITSVHPRHLVSAADILRGDHTVIWGLLQDVWSSCRFLSTYDRFQSPLKVQSQAVSQQHQAAAAAPSLNTSPRKSKSRLEVNPQIKNDHDDMPRDHRNIRMAQVITVPAPPSPPPPPPPAQQHQKEMRAVHTKPAIRKRNSVNVRAKCAASAPRPWSPPPMHDI